MAKDIWKRGDSWYINIWDPVGKVKIKKRIGPNKRAAEKVAEQVRARLLNNSLGLRAQIKAPTIDEYGPVFLADNYAGKPTTAVRAAHSLRVFRERVGNLKLTDITMAVMHQYISWRSKQLVHSPYRGRFASSEKARAWNGANRDRKKVAKGTVNCDIDTVKRMLNHALEREVIDRNPIARFKKFSTKDNARTRYLHHPEIKTLLSAAVESRSRQLLPGLVLSMYLGRRSGEIFKRRVKDYDRANGILFLGTTKKGRPESIPVPFAARRILDALCDQATTPWLFPNSKGTGPIKSMGTAFKVAKERAGITNFRWHDLRHTAISYMVMSGVDFFTIAALVGHTTPTMIQERYGHLSPRHMEASAVLFGGYMDRLTGGGAGAAPALTNTPIVAQVAEMLSREAASDMLIATIPAQPEAHAPQLVSVP